MPVDFDKLLHDPVFETFGIVATYVPPEGGSQIDCVVLRNQRDVEIGAFDVGRPMMQGDIVKVRKSEVAAPAKGGLFHIGAEVLRVADAPRCEDARRLVWTMTVR